VRELDGRGWIISIGHTRRMRNCSTALAKQGASYDPLHECDGAAASPSARTDRLGLMRDDVTCDLIADGIHLDPMTLRSCKN